MSCVRRYKSSETRLSNEMKLMLIYESMLTFKTTFIIIIHHYLSSFIIIIIYYHHSSLTLIVTIHHHHNLSLSSSLTINIHHHHSLSSLYQREILDCVQCRRFEAGVSLDHDPGFEVWLSALPSDLHTF